MHSKMAMRGIPLLHDNAHIRGDLNGWYMADCKDSFVAAKNELAETGHIMPSENVRGKVPQEKENKTKHFLFLAPASFFLCSIVVARHSTVQNRPTSGRICFRKKFGI